MAKKKRKKPAPAEEPELNTSGWDAITTAFERIYLDQTNPAHVASVPHPPFRDDQLIYGISGYKAAHPNHWHFVTYGFSELYEKESDDPAVSGWGFELTFRLARDDKEELPPNWAFNVLMNLGSYVRRSGNPFGNNHVLDLNGPICLGSDTAIRAIAFVTDPQMGSITTPNGSVEFLQIVGLTTDEHTACSDWSTAPVLELLRETSPLLVTDLSRRSMLESPAMAARVQEGIDREGSSSPLTYVSVVEWTITGRGKSRRATLTLGARGIQTLLPKLRSRLGYGREFALLTRQNVVEFRAAEQAGWAEEDGALIVNLDPAALQAFRQSLQPVRGTYTWPELPGLTLEVRPTEVTDSQGNVIEVIG
jgi:hypothetical protein